MANVDPRPARLRALGLTTYAARAYLALLEIGPVRARVLASEANVPVGKIYHTLESLRGKGLAAQIEENPNTYVALPLRLYLERLRLAQMEAFLDVQRVSETLVNDASRDVALHGAPSEWEVLAPLLEAVEDAVMIVGIDGAIHHANPAAGVMFASRDVSRMEDLVAPEDRASVRAHVSLFAAWERVPGTDAQVSMEVAALGADDAHVPCRLTFISLSSGGEPQGTLLVVLRALTDRAVRPEPVRLDASPEEIVPEHSTESAPWVQPSRVRGRDVDGRQ